MDIGWISGSNSDQWTIGSFKQLYCTGWINVEVNKFNQKPVDKLIFWLIVISRAYVTMLVNRFSYFCVTFVSPFWLIYLFIVQFNFNYFFNYILI